MGSNTNQTKNIFDNITEKDPIYRATSLQPKIGGTRCTPEEADVTVNTVITPVYTQAHDDSTQGIWYALATHDIKITRPEGFKKNSDNKFGSECRLGLLRISVEHDVSAQPLVNGWEVKCEHAGPGPTEESIVKESTVSVDIGANIGIFGSEPTAGVSANYSLSHTTSKTIHDVSLTTNMENKSRRVYWDFDFQGFDSPVSRSTFDYEVQEIWRYHNDADKTAKLGAISLKLDIEWRPQVFWIIGGSHVGEGTGDTLTCSFPMAMTKNIPKSKGFISGEDDE